MRLGEVLFEHEVEIVSGVLNKRWQEGCNGVEEIHLGNQGQLFFLMNGGSSRVVVVPPVGTVMREAVGGVGKEGLLDRIRGHLGAALAQSLVTDDQVIMQHVRESYVLAGGRLEWVSSQSGFTTSEKP
jgi:hypothetical protein